MIKYCLKNSQINSILQSGEFSYISLILSQNKRKSLRVKLAWADLIHSQREIEVLVLTLKNLPFPLISSEHKTAYKRPGSYSLTYSLPSLWKIRELSPFDHTMTTSTREPTTRAWILADICRQCGAICSKNSKIVPCHSCAQFPIPITALFITVSEPAYGSWPRRTPTPPRFMMFSCQSPADFKRATDGPGDESDKDGGRKYGHPQLENEKPFTESHKPEHLSLPLHRYLYQDVG